MLSATAFVRGDPAEEERLRPTLASLTHLGERAAVDVVVAPEVDLERATGRWVVCLDAGERLLPDWLDAVAAHPEADLVYGDSWLIGLPSEPARADRLWFRPAWSPTLYDGFPYFASGAAIRRELLVASDGQDPAALVAAATRRGAAIRHVGRPLVAELDRAVGSPPAPSPASRRSAASLTTIIIPTRDRLDLLRPCLDSIRRHTPEPHEILIVDNDSREPETRGFLDGDPATVVRVPGDFHFAALNNQAARRARGDRLVFLNNDTVVGDDRWLAGLLEAVAEPTVGAAGAKLLYPGGAIQHAGILVHDGARVDHLFSGVAPGDVTHPWALTLAHEVSAVTAACLAIRRDLFLRLGGFDEGLRIAFNDVDLCFRLRERGYRVIWTPAATLTHHECATRDPAPPLADEVAFRSRWIGTAFDGDPYLGAVRRAVGDALALPHGAYRRAEID